MLVYLQIVCVRINILQYTGVFILCYILLVFESLVSYFKWV